jgi:hypothetical protein
MDSDTDSKNYLADYLNKTTANSECTDDNLPYPYTPSENGGENVTSIRYDGRHDYRTCINSVTANNVYTDCSLVYGSASLDNDVSPL